MVLRNEFGTSKVKEEEAVPEPSLGWVGSDLLGGRI